MAYTQDNREAQLITPLGKDVLLLGEMVMSESLGHLFEISITAYSTDHAITLEDLLGQNVTVKLDLSAGGKRFYNGFVSHVTQSGSVGDDLSIYHIQVMPWFWFLTRTADCRIFQNMTVPDIVKKVFRDLGFTDFKDSLNSSYRVWEYCVQYRETDFNFVSRLLEQEGIYYYFEHADGKHVLVLADGYGSHSVIPGYATIRYIPDDASRVSTDEYITKHVLSVNLQSGVYALNDFDFERPKTKLQTDSTEIKSNMKADYEIFDYPGEYLQKGDGSVYARARIEELHTEYEQVSGAGLARGLFSGGLFTLKDCHRPDQNREYLVVMVEHIIELDDYQGTTPANNNIYTNAYSAIESKTQFRTRRETPKPVVQGPQTAMVVGTSGEEIYTDKYGRVKLQFHWDRYGKSDENSSCWVRVSQLWAGKNWGGMHIPRIGQEVIVEFLEGDPDRPIVTGRVYNGVNMPPYDLPANKTQSGIKSRSSMGGTSSDFNEIRMEDKKGEEQLYVHAERNMDSVVESNETLSVGYNRKKKVGNDETSDIAVNRTETVGGDEKIDITGNRTETVGINEDVTIGVNRSNTVGAMDSLTVGASRDATIGAMDSLTVGASYTVSVATQLNETIGVGHSSTVGAFYNQTVGGPITVTSGGPMTFTAAGGITMIAPAGTKIIDSFLSKVGGALTETYGQIIKGTPLKMEGTAVAIEGKGLNVEMGNLKTVQFGVGLQKLGALLCSTDSAALDKAGVKIAKAGIHLIG